jgi:YHS domain-containing protein
VKIDDFIEQQASEHQQRLSGETYFSAKEERNRRGRKAPDDHPLEEKAQEEAYFA